MFGDLRVCEFFLQGMSDTKLLSCRTGPKSSWNPVPGILMVFPIAVIAQATTEVSVSFPKSLPDYMSGSAFLCFSFLRMANHLVCSHSLCLVLTSTLGIHSSASTLCHPHRHTPAPFHHPVDLQNSVRTDKDYF